MASIPKGTVWPLADRIADGHLEQLIRKWRGDGFSAERIGQELHAEYGITVTGETVRKWIRDLDQARAS